MVSNEPLNPEIARLAAAQASKLFGQWMPERWLNLFIDSYDDIVASKWDLTDTILPSPLKLKIIEPTDRSSAILVCDEHGDIAEFYHNEHATVEQSYETALILARKLVAAANDPR